MKQVLRLCFSSVLIVLFFVLSILIAKIYFIDRFTAWGPIMPACIAIYTIITDICMTTAMRYSGSGRMPGTGRKRSVESEEQKHDGIA